MITNRIDVKLEKRSYPIYIGSDLVSIFGEKCLEHNVPQTCVLISDSNVAPLYSKPIVNSLTQQGFETHSIVIPAGERQKSLRRTNALYTELLQRGIGRKSALIALGGGVVGDLVGFVAATYQRGILLIQVPTTVLAQVDSSIGGKVGINHPLGKNMIGAFHQPVFVWEDVSYLSTLPPRERLCGIGEIVKYAIIRDSELFSFLEAHIETLLKGSREEFLYAQSRCVAIKAQVVSEDEFEQGIRVILNCGHTIGHALEVAGNYRVLKHGEAVLLGLLAESAIATKLGTLDRESFQRIVELIKRLPLKLKRSQLNMKAILPALQRDKKRIGKKTRFVIPKTIGNTIVVDEVPTSLIQESLRFVFTIVK
ncbi:MAG: 3-dehydroquinate synthase [Bacteroidetes bacterium]|nr:3-dehydroquinate synthase [Bacteroidota bacterium]